MTQQSCLIVFPDTNVLIQGRTLKDQPWGELDRDNIDVMLSGPVIRELDRLKNRPGRVGKVARSVSTKVRELMATAARAELLHEAEPRVMLRLAPGVPGQAKVREEIDLSHDDQAIINQALTSLDTGADVVLLTDDNFAAMTAEHFGLPVRMLPAHWLKEPEADDSVKELARKDAEIARLKTAEPLIQLRFVDQSGTQIDRLDVAMPRYLPVSSNDVDRLVEQVTTLAPMAELTPTRFKEVFKPPSTGKGFDISSIAFPDDGMMPLTQTDIDKYQDDYRKWVSGVRSKIAVFHVEWNRGRDWPQAIFCVQNTGSRPAADVLVEIAASGSFKLSGSEKNNSDRGAMRAKWLELALPPEPPRRKSRAEMLMAVGLFDRDPLAILPPTPFFPTVGNLRRDDDVFYWRDGRSDPVSTMALECKTWRHGREEEEFPFRIWADDSADVRGLIVGRISASNIREPIDKHLPLRVTFEDRDCLALAKTLVDDFERRLSQHSRMGK
jgi:hypothetical protein